MRQSLAVSQMLTSVGVRVGVDQSLPEVDDISARSAIKLIVIELDDALHSMSDCSVGARHLKATDLHVANRDRCSSDEDGASVFASRMG